MSCSTSTRKPSAAPFRAKRSTIWANKRFRTAVALLFWLAVWQVAAMAVGLELLLPQPLTVANTLLGLLPEAVFWRSVLFSLARVFGGLLAGTLLGVLFGALMAASPVWDTLLSPAVRLMRTVPVASFIVLALLWLESWLLPAVITTIVVLPVVCSNVKAGIAATDTQYLEMAYCYRFGRLKTLRLVYIPSVFPYFRAAVTSAIGMGWKSGVAAEVLCHPKLAIGSHLYDAKVYFETDQLFAWTIVVIILSLLFEKLLQLTVKEAKV